MSKVVPKFTETDTVTIKFVHFVTKQPSVFQFDCNPITGHWLFTQNGKAHEWFTDKTEVNGLIKRVIEKSAKNKCQCEVTVEHSKHPMHNKG
jgi:hypothetical protein